MALQCAQRAIAEAKQRSQWSVMGWMTKTLSSRAPPCFGRHVKLVPAAFAVVSTHSNFKEYRQVPGHNNMMKDMYRPHLVG
jgi:hypothetical protein